VLTRLVYDLAKLRSNIFRDPLNFVKKEINSDFPFKVEAIIITPYMVSLMSCAAATDPLTLSSAATDMYNCLKQVSVRA